MHRNSWEMNKVKKIVLVEYLDFLDLTTELIRSSDIPPQSKHSSNDNLENEEEKEDGEIDEFDHDVLV